MVDFTVGTRGLQPVIPPSTLQNVQWAVATGTSDDILAAYPTPNTVLSDGLILGFRATSANTTTAPVFQPDGLAAAVITKLGGSALRVGDINGSLSEVLVRYNLANARWELLNPATTPIPVGSAVVDKTAAFAVHNADNGTTFTLGGGSPFTVNFSDGLGTYTSNFSVELINTENIAGSGRAKLINLPSGTFYLYPGQRIRVFKDGGILDYTPKNQRYRCIPFNCYVDPSGLDTNDGLAPGAGNAFKTIQKAVNFIRASVDGGGGGYGINIAPGTYRESVAFSSQMINHHIIFVNGSPTTNPVDARSYVIWPLNPSDGPCCDVEDRACVVFSGLTFNNPGGIGVVSRQFAIIDYGYCSFNDFTGGTAISTRQLCSSSLVGCEFTGNFVVAVGCGTNATVEFGGVPTSIPNVLTFTLFFSISEGGRVSLDPGMDFTGAGQGANSSGQKYNISVLASLTTAGLTSKIPGGTAGVTSNGGLAVGG